jgi:predicted secreted Zn-dependent protease
MKSGIVGALLAFGVAGYALAQVYKWVDADGRVHYGAQPPSAVKARPLAQRQSHGVNPESQVEVPESAIQYYPVYGSTPLELHMSMVQNGPFNEIVQKRVYAEIHWRITWKFDYIDEPGKCRLNKFTITMPTTITMPKWMDAEGAPAETQALWPTVLGKIRLHEDGHKAIGMEGANVLARRLKSLPVYPTCHELNRVIRNEGERIVGEYNLANRAFDRSEALRGSPFKEER